MCLPAIAVDPYPQSVDWGLCRPAQREANMRHNKTSTTITRLEWITSEAHGFRGHKQDVAIGLIWCNRATPTVVARKSINCVCLSCMLAKRMHRVSNCWTSGRVVLEPSIPHSVAGWSLELISSEVQGIRRVTISCRRCNGAKAAIWFGCNPARIHKLHTMSVLCVLPLDIEYTLAEAVANLYLPYRSRFQHKTLRRFNNHRRPFCVTFFEQVR